MNQFIQNLQVLNANELKIINNHIDSLDFTPSTVFGKDAAVRVDNKIRTSTGTTLQENIAVTMLLHEKLNAAVWEYTQKLLKNKLVLNMYPLVGGHATTSHREGIQILEYTKEQQYNWHFDTCTNRDSYYYHRQISIVLYLKDDFVGGATKFAMSSKKFRPKAGRGLFFPSNWCFTHCSTPVESGKKRVAVTWYYCNCTSG